MKRFNLAALALLTSLGASAAVTQAMIDGLHWRSVGPAVMGGRITGIAGVPGEIGPLYVASASGGLFRSDDAGTTWQPLFDRQSTISIGALALDPRQPKTIWVGTGESNLRNSVSFGDGVYRSTDGGLNWQHMGLRETMTISGITVDPTNSNRVLVAAVGHPFGPNPERGVFLSEDGGASWKKTLFIDNEHGAVGLESNPSNPRVAYAGLWRFDRKPWTFTSGSDKGGVYKSDDGGLTWHKLTSGLPALVGRVGIRVAPSNSEVVYILAESKEGTLFRSEDGGNSFQRVSDDRELVGRAYYFTDLRVASDSPYHVFALADGLLESKDGGKHFSRIGVSVHGDLHALWLDPKELRRLWQGNDGGLAVSYDAGTHWEQINNLPLGQLYHVSADSRRPFYQVTVGMQDDGTWIGPSRTREPAGIFNDDWRMLNSYTGFASVTDSENPDVVITEQPGGALLKTDTRTREQQVISPQPQSFGGAPAKSMPYRFNWDAPLVRSPFGKNTLYLGGNVVFQSSDMGKSWEALSHDLTSHDEARLGNVGGPIAGDNSASEVYATITALAESPAKQNLLWAGTDDGNLQVTTNGGGSWTNVIGSIQGLPAHSPVTHIEPSANSASTAYASFDRHMFDDFQPYLFRTRNQGRTWQPIHQGLPSTAYVWTVRQDPQQPRLLYAGTELGLYVSFDEGDHWLSMHGKNLPYAVAVRDIVFPPSLNELLVATHGRSLWILDDRTPLQELAKTETNPDDAVLFPISDALRYSMRPTRFAFGDKPFIGANPEYGAQLSYYLPASHTEAKIEILDTAGRPVQTLRAPAGNGLQSVVWNLRYAGLAGGGRGGREAPGAQAVPGFYTARLTAAGVDLRRMFRVGMDRDVAVKEEDLEAQFRIAQELIGMRREVGKAVNEISQMPDSAEKSALLGQLRRARGVGRSEAPAGLQEDLEALFTMVDSLNAAPTSAQMSLHDALKGRFADAMAKVQQLKQRGS